MNLLETRRNRDFLIIAIIGVFGILFHHSYLNEFPSHTHAWTQSDRYAISQGFVNNDLNFFRPETYLLNPKDSVASGIQENSITSVDFPLHDFIPAIAMKLDGSRAPWHSRLYVLLYSMLGLFFLYRLSFELSSSFWKSLLVVVFALSSPVFVYYQSGFLPTIPSLSNAIIGIYFYVLFLNKGKSRSFHLSLLFLTLAALSRTTFVIPLVAVFCFELLRVFGKESPLKPRILPVLISISAILGYYFYNRFLQEQYGTIFLQSILPPENIQEAKEILKGVYETWSGVYFSKFHYLLVFVLVVYLAFLFLNGTVKTGAWHGSIVSKFSALSLIMLLGSGMFAILMLKQYTHHDYYFLDTFFLPLLCMLIVLVSVIPENNSRVEKLGIGGLILLFVIASSFHAVNFQKSRRRTGSWDRVQTTINNYKESKAFLDAADVADTARILAIDTYAPNIPFIFMGRKGYGLNTTRRERIIEALEWDFEYITIQNELFVSDIYSTYPEILSRIEKVADNGSISLCVLRDTVQDQSLDAFIGIEGKEPVFGSKMTYDTLPDKNWQNIDTSSQRSFGGEYSGILLAEKKYGITYKTSDLGVLKERSCLVVFRGAFYSDSIRDCNVAVVLNARGENLYYKAFNLKDLMSNDGVWEELELTYQLPRVSGKEYEFALFMQNSGRGTWWVDDFGFAVY